jgi:hypothetical protein
MAFTAIVLRIIREGKNLEGLKVGEVKLQEENDPPLPEQRKSDPAPWQRRGRGGIVRIVPPGSWRAAWPFSTD